jgi:hypothetical protein
MEGVFMTQHNDGIGDEPSYPRINQLQNGLIQRWFGLKNKWILDGKGYKKNLS